MSNLVVPPAGKPSGMIAAAMIEGFWPDDAALSAFEQVQSAWVAAAAVLESGADQMAAARQAVQEGLGRGGRGRIVMCRCRRRRRRRLWRR